MMAEREKAPSYPDTGLPQKPVNLDSKVPIQFKRKSSVDNDDEGNRQEKLANGGYYLNVAQKGKLILPTALWIMLIIAGICFLTLLASLNKTISTLDTLVELEQEKEARVLVDEHLHHHRLNKDLERELKRSKEQQGADGKSQKRSEQQRRQKKAKELSKDLVSSTEMNFNRFDGEPDHDHANAWFFPIDPSLFSMPSWTSLEPIRHKPPPRDHGLVHQQSPPSMLPPIGLIDDLMMGQSRPDAIVAVRQEGPMDPQPDGLLNSIMKQMGSMLDSFGRGSEVMVDPMDKMRPVQVDGESSGPTISAKIDNLNVHINSAGPTSQAEDNRQSREEEISSLEKSIDNLVGKLMEQKVPHGSALHHPSRLGQQQMQSQIEEIVPIVKHEGHHRRPLLPPISPLADLLMSPSPVSFNHKNQDKPTLMQTFNLEALHPFSNPSKLANLIDDNSGDAQFIIAISDKQEAPVSKPSRETNRHHISNTRRPSFNPEPYEISPLIFANDQLMNPFDMMSIKPVGQLTSPHHNREKQHQKDHFVTKAGKSDDAEWDMLANNLVQTLAEDMIKHQQLHQQNQQHHHLHNHNNKEGDKPDDQTQVLLVETNMPLASGEQPTVMTADDLMKAFTSDGFQSKPGNKDKNHKEANSDQLGDVFNLIFGPPPTSKLVVLEPKQPHQEVSSSSTSTKSDAKTTSAESKPATSIMLVEPKVKQIVSTQTLSQPTDITDLPNEAKMSPKAKSSVIIGQLPISTIAVTKQEIDEEEKRAHKETQDMLNDFVSTMFTLPQMSGEQRQTNTTSGPKPASNGAPAVSTNATITFTGV